ncbi:hypothetical protein BDZ94DRAFT_1168507 [Collybia nuda]|uniref:Uncharacterized protein n=1 Tax=Collybia nuda TaxID=64659 RepID=A0A9P5Y4F7_9AGAR|nr:hypothetical protein BDZ94DRAFT_1168507 [Collybia nuda]
MFIRSIILIIIATSVVNLLLFGTIREFTRDDLDPVARERVRREWNKEMQNHQVFMKHVETVRAQWVLESQEHEKERSVMIIERRTWQAEMKEQEEKLSRLSHTIDQDRRDWETEKWKRERDWERKRREEAAERKRREDEERRRAGMHWEDLIPSQRCLSHGTREYTAKLVGIPWGYNYLSTCRETEAEIHGRSIRPQSCEERGSDGVWAKWIIDFQEPTCTTWWSNLIDKGCTAPGSRTRRYEQHLENIPWGDDWKVMCTSAPTDFLGHHFDSPTSCANWGRQGIFGYWDVRDSSC